MGLAEKVKEEASTIAQALYHTIPIVFGEFGAGYGLVKGHSFYLACGGTAFILGIAGVIQVLRKDDSPTGLFEYTPFPIIAIATTAVSSLATMEMALGMLR